MLNELFTLNKIKEGDIKAFEEVFRRYYSPLCWYAASIIGSVQAGEEIVEELFYVLWRDREHLQVFHSLKSYLYRAVRNESVQYCEHKYVEERYSRNVPTESEEDTTSDPQVQMEYRELQMMIGHTLDKLPERRAKIFKMHRMQGKKYAEIATELSLSVKTVEAEMTKALRMLRTELEHYIGDG